MKWDILGIASDEFDKLGIDVIYAFAETVFLAPQKGPLCPFTLKPQSSTPDAYCLFFNHFKLIFCLNRTIHHKFC